MLIIIWGELLSSTFSFLLLDADDDDMLFKRESFLVLVREIGSNHSGLLQLGALRPGKSRKAF